MNIPLLHETDGLNAPFTDLQQLPQDAADAVEAVRSGGLINGMPDGRFDPEGKATRAQAAAVIYRLLGKAE
ncbi:S-layer homology domain-containing protein [Paenibacillus sp. PK3_47]|uniref:S-layer homology domain-containing protein n=1 Tax=Paenibacillus sp. PK3_47 TaxID=2072642 RepID=UPI00201DE46A|nr:S-layer homology domain-containing protein [Paenibacillus sp. PK3_47]